jgi:hypothetical protein
MSEFYSNFVLFLDQTNRFGKKNLDDFQFVWQMIDCRTHPALQVLGKVPDRLSQAVWDGKQHLKNKSCNISILLRDENYSEFLTVIQ